MELSWRDCLPVFSLIPNWHMEKKPWKLPFSLDLHFKKELVEYSYPWDKGSCIKGSKLLE